MGLGGEGGNGEIEGDLGGKWGKEVKRRILCLKGNRRGEKEVTRPGGKKRKSTSLHAAPNCPQMTM